MWRVGECKKGEGKKRKGDLDVLDFDPIFGVGGRGPFPLLPMLSSEGNEDEEGESGVKTITRPKVKRPPRYKVLIHNDDYTTMEFVVWILKRFFGKSQAEADSIMLKVHNEGAGVCGVYTYEVAETKVAQVSKAAKDEGHPLLCTLEKE